VLFASSWALKMKSLGVRRLFYWRFAAAVAISIICNWNPSSAAPFNFSKIFSDPVRPLFYGLNNTTNGGSTSTLVALNQVSLAVENEVDFGQNITGIALNTEGTFFYASSGVSSSIFKIDANTFDLIGGKPAGTNGPVKVFGAVGNKVFFMWIKNNRSNGLNVFNFDTGTIEKMLYPGLDYTESIASKDGKNFYAAHYNGFPEPEYLDWVQVDTGTLKRKGMAGAHDFTRNYPVLITKDDSLVFYLYESVTPSLSPVMTFPERILAISAEGEIALSATNAYQGKTAKKITELPIVITDAAISGDQTRVLLYNANSKELYSVESILFGFMPEQDLIPSPADGASLQPPFPLQLSWNATDAFSYDIYLGTNLVEVSGADTNSPVYVGNTRSNFVAFPSEPARGVTNYWRVDQLGFRAIKKGPVWSFYTEPTPESIGLSIPNSFISIEGISGAVLQQELQIASSDGTARAWSISSPMSELKFAPSSGITPATVKITVDSASFPAGMKETEATLRTDAGSVKLRVFINAAKMNLSLLIPDKERPFLYGTDRTNSSLIAFSAETGKITNVLTLPNGAGEIDIDTENQYLYALSTEGGMIYQVDLNTFTIADTQFFSSRTLHHLEAVTGDTLFLDSRDPACGCYRPIDKFDFSDGAVTGSYNDQNRSLVSFSATPGGNYIYALFSSPDGFLFKSLQIANPVWSSPFLVTNALPGQRLLVTEDGTLAFYYTYALAPIPAPATVVAKFQDPIFAITKNGERAFSRTTIYGGRTGEKLGEISSPSSIMSVSPDGLKLFAFDPESGSLKLIEEESEPEPILPEFSQPEVSGDTFNVTLSGAPGTTLVLESSTDLTEWKQVRGVAIPPSGSTQIQVPRTNDVSFFKARVVQ
jgi:hypothetical protein